MLACVFEEFRVSVTRHMNWKVDTISLAPQLPCDDFLKHCQADIELLTEQLQLEMLENMIRHSTDIRQNALPG